MTPNADEEKTPPTSSVPDSVSSDGKAASSPRGKRPFLRGSSAIGGAGASKKRASPKAPAMRPGSGIDRSLPKSDRDSCGDCGRIFCDECAGDS